MRRIWSVRRWAGARSPSTAALPLYRLSVPRSHHAAHHPTAINRQPEWPCRIVSAYRQYRTDTECEIRRWEASYERLSAGHKALLGSQPAKFAAARRAAYQNHLFITALLQAFTEDEEEDGAC